MEAGHSGGMKTADMLRFPSAFLPLVMSFSALLTVGIHLTIYGVNREPDEGTVAHLWQLLMAAQVPLSGFFLVRWLPRAPRPALTILALQVAAAVAALAPVYFLHL